MEKQKAISTHMQSLIDSECQPKICDNIPVNNALNGPFECV